MLLSACFFVQLLHTALSNAHIVAEWMVLKIMDIGGSLLLFDQTSDGFSALQIALLNGKHVSLNVLNSLIDQGGDRLIKLANSRVLGSAAPSLAPSSALKARSSIPQQSTALHIAFTRPSVPFSILTRLLDPAVSSAETLCAQDLRDAAVSHTVLHAAVESLNHISTRLVISLIKRGGDLLIMKKRISHPFQPNVNVKSVFESTLSFPSSHKSSPSVGSSGRYEETLIADSTKGEKVTAISAQPMHANKSFEELRYEDTPSLRNTSSKKAPTKPTVVNVVKPSNHFTVLHDIMKPSAALLASNTHVHLDIIMCLIEVGQAGALMAKTASGMNVLQVALSNPHVAFGVVSKMIEVGRLPLLAAVDNDGHNAIHVAVKNCAQLPPGVVEKMFSVCSAAEQKSLVTAQSTNTGETPLHLSLQQPMDTGFVSMLVNTGGQDVLCILDKQGLTPFTKLVKQSTLPSVVPSSVDLLTTLVDVGGLDMLASVTATGDNALHTLAHQGCLKAMPPALVDSILSNGKSLVASQNNVGDTVLHAALRNWHTSLNDAVFARMLRLGGNTVCSICNQDRQTVLNVALGTFNRTYGTAAKMLPSSSCPVSFVEQLLEVGGSSLVALSGQAQGSVKASIDAAEYPAGIKKKIISLGGNMMLGCGWSSSAGGRACIINLRYICNTMAALEDAAFTQAYKSHFENAALMARLLRTADPLPQTAGVYMCLWCSLSVSAGVYASVVFAVCQR